MIKYCWCLKRRNLHTELECNPVVYKEFINKFNKKDMISGTNKQGEMPYGISLREAQTCASQKKEVKKYN